MGNTNTSDKNLDIDIMSDYKEIKKNQSGVILQNNQTHLTYLLKEFTFASDITYEHERHKLQKQMEEKFENVLSVVKIKTHTIHGLCSITHKILVIYEYPQVTLLDQIIARQKEEKRFDEHQLWSILQSCNLALTQSKPTISLNSHQIFITPDGILKIIHSDLFDQSYRYMINDTYFYAPQKIRNFNKIDNELSLIKESVFSMGLTILQAALLQQIMDCYDFDQRLFLQKNLSNFIQSLVDVYSSDLIHILERMLHQDPNQRPAFHEIQKLLDNYWSNEVPQKRFASSVNNYGQSLNIHGEIEKKITFNSNEKGDKGIYNNLVTINSNQKQSIGFQSNNRPVFNLQKMQKITESVQPSNLNKNQISYKTSINQSIERESCSNKTKQNLYTDPKLLEMIRKDLSDINKLKQSTLKQTIKYSFLYPETQAIFSSIKDIKLTNKHESNKRLNNALKDKNNIVCSAFETKDQKEYNKDYKLQQKFQKLQHSKEFSIQRQNQMQMRKLKKSLESIEHYVGFDCEGKMYEGQMIHNKKQGWGKLMFDDGAYYQGQFKNDQINGRGILYYKPNHPAYDGMWLEGKFHGHGILYNQQPTKLFQAFDFRDFDQIQQNWIKYEGEFYADSKWGKGKLYISNGEIIEGNFQNDQINGKCKFIDIDGQGITGIWHENKLVKIDKQ